MMRIDAARGGGGEGGPSTMAYMMAHGYGTIEPNAHPTSATIFRQHSAHPPAQYPSQHPVPHPSYAHAPPIALINEHSHTQVGTGFEHLTTSMPLSAGILLQSQHKTQTPNILPQNFPPSHMIRNQALLAWQPASALPMDPGRMSVPVHQTQMNPDFTSGNPPPLIPGEQTHPWLGHREWDDDKYRDGLDIIYGHLKVSPNSMIS
jgi:hypothetical protein